MLFLIGIAFAYFLVFPSMIRFMSEMNRNIGAAEIYGVSAFFTFLFNIIFPIAVAFEMPVVVLFLTKVGVLNPHKLSKVRKYAYLVLVIVGSMISPPDFVSHLAVSIPLILLFEASVICSRVYAARKALSERSIRA
jgi:sec-independent protein translocase protein TatC